MRSEELIKKLIKINKSFYTTADIIKITGRPRQSVLVTLNRLVEAGKLVRLRRNNYVLAGQNINYELIAEQINPESYISFESALSRYGILSQIPYSLTLATTSRSRIIILGNREIIYRKIKKDLFGNYKIENNIRVAYPEKAFLDLLYLISRGQSRMNLDELDLSVFNRSKLKRLSKKYPQYTKDLLKKYI